MRLGALAVLLDVLIQPPQALVGHVQDWLVHEGVQVNVLGCHEHHLLHDIDGVYLTYEQLLEPSQQLRCLIGLNAGQEGRIPNLLCHELLSNYPYSN